MRVLIVDDEEIKRVSLVDDLTQAGHFAVAAACGEEALGLGLCRMLISEMGGRIAVESLVGRGTTFRIALKTSDLQIKVSET